MFALDAKINVSLNSFFPLLTYVMSRWIAPLKRPTILPESIHKAYQCLQLAMSITAE